MNASPDLPAAAGRRFAVVWAAFNEVITARLLEGAVACFQAHGVPADGMTVVRAPGAFELPLVAKQLAETGRYAAVVCLGAVVRGETAHFDYVAGEAARGIQQVSLSTGVPVTFGVLTTDTMEQALERAGGRHGNKGWDAASAAMAMADVRDEILARG